MSILTNLFSEFDPQSRKRRANSGMFEEMRTGSVERECYEERCNLEEVYEIFSHDKQTTMTFWNETVNQCRYASQKCQLPGTKKCINRWNRMVCKCRRGFRGKFCQDDIDVCLEAEKRGKPLCSGPYKHCIDKRGRRYRLCGKYVITTGKK